MTVLNDEELTVISVAAPTVEEEPEPSTAPADAQPEVLSAKRSRTPPRPRRRKTISLFLRVRGARAFRTAAVFSFHAVPTASPAAPPIRLVAGLGNPGREYENTRHNAGFMVIDRLAQRLGLALGYSNGWQALWARGTDGCTYFKRMTLLERLFGDADYHLRRYAAARARAGVSAREVAAAATV